MQFVVFFNLFKDRADRTTSDEPKTHLLDLQKTFIVVEGV